MEQQIAYCTTPDGVRIAYATYGNDSAPPLVHLPEIPGQESIWASSWGRRFYQELARHRRLITFDSRGFGASQRDADSPHMESSTADLAAVADHLRLDRFELFTAGWSPCARAILYAGARAGRISKLALFHPSIASSSTMAATAEIARASYAIYLRSLATLYFPSGPPEVQRWFSKGSRSATSAETMAQLLSRTFDLVSILPQLTMPVLVLHRQRAQVVATTEVRTLASLIPGSRLVVLDGDAGAPYWDYEQFIDILYDFLGIEASAPAPTAPSGTAVILFTDIADSTALTERVGDAAFRTQSRALDATMRAAMSDAGGTPVSGKVLGDGVMGVFTSASQAIQAARGCVDAGGELRLHIGLHAGDVIREDDNVYGGAVNIASRICGLCEPGEILVSATVRDLARTSAGVTFEDRGEQMLKGIEDPVRVFAVHGEAG